MRNQNDDVIVSDVKSAIHVYTSINRIQPGTDENNFMIYMTDLNSRKLLLFH